MNLSQTLAKLSDPTKELNETRRNSFTLRTQRDLPVRPSRESPRKDKFPKHKGYFFYFFDGFSSILLLFIVFLAIEANLNTNQISSSITYSLFSDIVLYIFLLAWTSTAETDSTSITVGSSNSITIAAPWVARHVLLFSASDKFSVVRADKMRHGRFLQIPWFLACWRKRDFLAFGGVW